MNEWHAFAAGAVRFDVGKKCSCFEDVFVFACESVKILRHEVLFVWVYFDVFDCEL